MKATRRGYLTTTILALLIGAVAQARSDTITLDVTADIDGRDDLIIVGDTLQWQHFDFTPVGLHNPDYPSTILTTTLNGVTELNSYAWTPTWPNGTGSGAMSSVFSGLSPSVPLQDMTVTLDVEQARDSLTLVQLPSATNGFTTVLEFNDDGFGGDALYEGQLTFTFAAVPEPSGLLLAAIAAGTVGTCTGFRRRRGMRRPVRMNAVWNRSKSSGPEPVPSA
jgi:hypothetical protein